MKNEIEIARNLGFEDIPTRKELYEEIERLKARLNPKVLYGIERGKVETLVNVVVEYHFDIEGLPMCGWVEADEIGKYAFLTKAEAEKTLKGKQK